MGDKNISPIRWIYNKSKNKIPLLLLITGLGMFVSFCSVKFALNSKTIIDIAVGNNKGELIPALLSLAYIILAQLLAGILVSIFKVTITGRIAINIKTATFKALMDKDWQNVSKYHSGELTNRINSDSAIISGGIVSIIPDAFSLITQILLSYFAIWSLDRTFAMIYLFVGPLILIVARIYGRRMKTLHKACQESNGRIRSFMQECIQNILVIKSFSNEYIMQKRSDNLQEYDLKLNIKKNYISIIANITFFLALTVGYYFALGWCAIKISRGIMTVGTLTAILQLVGQVQTPFKNLASIIPQYYGALASIERITELEELPNEVNKNDKVYDCGEIYKKMKCIVFENVYFKYDDEYVIENMSLRIEKGEVTALVGKSGAGKSTIIRLMLGIISPDMGSIYILTEDEKVIYVDKEIRKMFAYVPQNNMILSGTILDNIVFSDDKPDFDRAMASSQIAVIYDYIMTLPNGFDTKLSEGGAGLSEGQIQRLAIARAVYHDSPIMLLDEVTSALDLATEKKVISNLKGLKTKTCIIVSHKKTSVDECERIIDIEKI